MTAKNTKKSKEEGPLSFAAFLESIPPGTERRVTDPLKTLRILPTGDGADLDVDCPELQIHCPKCGGVRRFTGVRNSVRKPLMTEIDAFLHYTCCNCMISSKAYAVRVGWGKDRRGHATVKFGEIPSFGSPLSPRLRKLINPDWRLFLRGWRSECQGLGIGSFAYYRRVVENQKNLILERIETAANRLGADEAFLEALNRAKGERQFTRSISLVKDKVPERLKIKGRNPLLLLHRALSVGLHGLSDEQCLKQAHAIRVVLTGLASNIAQITADDAELTTALKTLEKPAR